MKSIDAGVLPGGRAVSRARLLGVTPPSADERVMNNGNGALGSRVASTSRHVAGTLGVASVPPGGNEHHGTAAARPVHSPGCGPRARRPVQGRICNE